jgi:transcriptional regulator with XRE-family HTH domain
MLTGNQTVKFVFGLKVRALRIKKGLSFASLAEKTGLSISFLNEIEKGKKYPKADKILLLAENLGVEYDDLVSLKLDPEREGLVLLLNSTFFREFPLEFFGLDAQKLLEIVSEAPDKVNAFIHAILEIVRNYDITRERFYFAALQAYQELRNNYFEEVEQQVVAFRKAFHIHNTIPVDRKQWYDILETHFQVRIDKKAMPGKQALRDLRSYYHPESSTFYLNKGLNASQVGFLQGRELAFQYMSLKDRPLQTPLVETDSFEMALSNFQASYFSVALLMDEHEMVRDIKDLFKQKQWTQGSIASLLRKYEATPEMLMQRLTNLLPRHFGVKQLFFLRFEGRPELNLYHLTKELHLAGHHHPHANFLSEHYCRRWVAIQAIEKLYKQPQPEEVQVSAQLSSYHETPNRYLCISLAWRNNSSPEVFISVTIGFLADEELLTKLKFANDPQIPRRLVHTTCERCSIADCRERAAAPALLEEQKQADGIEEALRELVSAEIKK